MKNRLWLCTIYGIILWVGVVGKQDNARSETVAISYLSFLTMSIASHWNISRMMYVISKLKHLRTCLQSFSYLLLLWWWPRDMLRQWNLSVDMAWITESSKGGRCWEVGQLTLCSVWTRKLTNELHWEKLLAHVVMLYNLFYPNSCFIKHVLLIVPLIFR